MHDTMQMTAGENKNHPVNDAYIGNEAEQAESPLRPKKLHKTMKTKCNKPPQNSAVKAAKTPTFC